MDHLVDNSYGCRGWDTAVLECLSIDESTCKHMWPTQHTRFLFSHDAGLPCLTHFAVVSGPSQRYRPLVTGTYPNSLIHQPVIRRGRGTTYINWYYPTKWKELQRRWVIKSHLIICNCKAENTFVCNYLYIDDTYVLCNIYHTRTTCYNKL